MSIRTWIRNWLYAETTNSPMLAEAIRAGNDIEVEAAQLSFAIIKATNGYIIKVSMYKPQQRGPDWFHELYIVKDDEKIPDVITRIMAIKALEG